MAKSKKIFLTHFRNILNFAYYCTVGFDLEPSLGKLGLIFVLIDQVLVLSQAKTVQPIYGRCTAITMICSDTCTYLFLYPNWGKKYLFMVFTSKSWVLFFPYMIASLRHCLLMFTTYLYTNSHLYVILSIL